MISIKGQKVQTRDARMEHANATTVLGRPPQLSKIHNNYPTFPLNSSKYKKLIFNMF